MRALRVIRVLAALSLGWMLWYLPLWDMVAAIICVLVIDICGQVLVRIPLERLVAQYKSLSDEIAKGMK